MSFFRVINNLFRFNRTNWKAVSLCFIAATVFWFFNALNKDYATNLHFPLRFEFDQHRFVPAKPLPNDVYVNVSGKGWDLLRKFIAIKLPALVIALEHPVETKKIVGSTLPSILASQVGSLKVNHIVTDTLYLAIESKDSTRVKAFIDSRQINFRNGFGRTSPIVVLPDSVELVGPVSALRKLPDSLIVRLPAAKPTSEYREQLEVRMEGLESIRRNPPVVEVMFEVGEVIEVQQKIKLSIVHMPSFNHAMQDKDSVNCVIQIPKGRAQDFQQTSSGLAAEINVREARIGGRKVVPSITGLPSYSVLISTDSVRVKIY